MKERLNALNVKNPQLDLKNFVEGNSDGSPTCLIYVDDHTIRPIIGDETPFTEAPEHYIPQNHFPTSESEVITIYVTPPQANHNEDNSEVLVGGTTISESSTLGN